MHWTDLPHTLQHVLEQIAHTRAVHAVYHPPKRAYTLTGLETPIRTIELYSVCWRGIRAFRARVPYTSAETPADALLRLLLQNGVQNSLNRPGYCVRVARTLTGEPLRQRLVHRLHQIQTNHATIHNLPDLLW